MVCTDVITSGTFLFRTPQNNNAKWPNPMPSAFSVAECDSFLMKMCSV